MPYCGYLTRRYRYHINVEQTQGSESVAYLRKYAFNPPPTTYVRMHRVPESESSRWQDAARDNRRNYIIVSMYAREVGAVEACWSLYKFCIVRLIPIVDAHSIYLEEKGTFPLPRSASTVHQKVGDSILVRYFKRLQIYSSL